MKTTDEFLRSVQMAPGIWRGDIGDIIKLRDAEHASQLAAAERTIEKLGQDAAAIAGRLDRAVEVLRRVDVTIGEATYCGQCDTREAVAVLYDVEKFLAPSQPEPSKAPLMCACHMEEHMVCDICQGIAGKDIIPENAGTTCSACRGKGGFDPFGVPMEGQTNPAYQCGHCQGRGTK